MCFSSSKCWNISLLDITGENIDDISLLIHYTVDGKIDSSHFGTLHCILRPGVSRNDSFGIGTSSEYLSKSLMSHSVMFDDTDIGRTPRHNYFAPAAETVTGVRSNTLYRNFKIAGH